MCVLFFLRVRRPPVSTQSRSSAASEVYKGQLYNSKFLPGWAVPKRYEEEGFFAKAETISELARKISVDVAGLEDTVRKMNGYARNGEDPDCHRGESAYDRYYGDPRVTPNPCLGPVDKPPYYAMKVDPGDFGTQGGMVTNADAQVMH